MSDIGELVIKLIAAGVPPDLAAQIATEAFLAGSLSAQYRGDRQYRPIPPSGKYVYFAGAGWDVVKIGISKNPWARINELQVGHQDKLQILRTFKCDAYSEKELHEVLEDFRSRGEWFKLPPNVVDLVVGMAKDATYEALCAALRSELRSPPTSLAKEKVSHTLPKENITTPPLNPPKQERRRGTRLPQDWTPTSKNIADAKAEGLSDGDIAREAPQFRDYWAGVPGQKGVKLDWDATWRNRCRFVAEKRGLAAKAASPVDEVPRHGQIRGDQIWFHMDSKEFRERGGGYTDRYCGRWFPREAA